MNKQLRKYYWALLLLVSSCLYTGCSKQLEEAPAPTVRVSAVDQQVKREDIRQLKKLFLDKKYNEKLVQKFSDTLYIYWTPQWNKASQKGTPKSITYTYVPLEPKLRVSPYTMGMVGVKEFLLIKRENGQIDFSVATYMYTEPRNKRAVSPYDPKFFTKFTGMLTLKHLATGEGARFIYTNGLTPQTVASNSATSSPTSSSAPTAANGISNDIVCYDYVICYWTSGCAHTPDGRSGPFVAGTVTSGLGGCEYPGQEPCSDWGSNWSLNGSTTEQQCHQEDPPPPPDSPPGDGGGGDDGDDLEAQIYKEKFALYGPCPGLTDAWKQIINYVPPSQVLNRLYSLDYFGNEQKYFQNFVGVQTIENSSGIAINLDEFSIKINKFPNNLNYYNFSKYIRTHINDFVDTDISSFHTAPFSGEIEKWESDNSLGSIIFIDIPLDKGSVVVSSENDYSWGFTTIHDPWNGGHPVSGNRTFGLMINNSNEIFFHTMGADRIGFWLDDVIGQISNLSQFQPLQFTEADKLWESMQRKVADYINKNGGSAEIILPTKNRPRWSDVKYALDHNLPLTTVTCP